MSKEMQINYSDVHQRCALCAKMNDDAMKVIYAALHVLIAFLAGRRTKPPHGEEEEGLNR